MSDKKVIDIFNFFKKETPFSDKGVSSFQNHSNPIKNVKTKFFLSLFNKNNKFSFKDLY